MSNIYVISLGNGYAYVYNPNPNNGDVINIYADPDPGETLLYLTMVDQNGYSIAIYVQQIQTLTYNSSWGDCTITATFSHDVITVNTDGNGTAYVDDYSPHNGDTVTLYTSPNPHYILDHIECSDLNGNILWTSTTDTTQFIYDSSWGDIIIDVYFDKKWLFKNLWLLKVAQDWRFR